MRFLPDVNVWLALSWSGHPHHHAAAEWFESAEGNRAFCRVTQMGLLRLLTLRALMGEQLLTRVEAWRVYTALEADHRVSRVEEPGNVEAVWRTMSARPDNSHRLWTDDYLAAFAQCAAMTLVTFDQGLIARHGSVSALNPAA